MSNTILLADDSVTIQKVTELIFMDSEFDVVAVSNGDDALARLATLNPAVVIADVHMPGANGYEVCRRTKEHDSTIPVILLVGMFEEFDEEDASQCGSDAYLKKSFDSQELLALVKRLHAERGDGDAVPLSEAIEASQSPPEAAPEADDPGDETSALEVTSEEAGAPVWGNLDLASTPPAGVDSLVAGEVVEEAIESRPFGTLITPTVQSVGSLAPDSQDEPFGTLITPALEVETEPVPEPAAEPVAASPVAAPSIEPAATVESATMESDSAESATVESDSVESTAVESDEPVVAAASPLSDDDVDRIARRIVELLGDEPVREVAWEVIPDLAEVVIKDRIRQLEAQAEN